MIYYGTISILNEINKKVDIDQSDGKTTWYHRVYRQAGSVLTGWITGNSDIAMDGKIFIINNEND